jgi:ABC-type uncharacterized transport system YnjBCD ATPase subunit
MFQNYALFPHLSLTDNVAFPLKVKGAASVERRERAREMLGRVQLGHLAERMGEGVDDEAAEEIPFRHRSKHQRILRQGCMDFCAILLSDH